MAGHSCLTPRGRMEWSALASHAWDRGRLTSTQRLCPQALTTPYPIPPHSTPPPSSCAGGGESERLVRSSPSQPPSVQGGGATDIDNEIFGSSALWEQTPRRLLSRPGEGVGRLTVQDGDHCLLPTLGVWLRGRCPDLLPGRTSGPRHPAPRGPRQAGRLVTDR